MNFGNMAKHHAFHKGVATEIEAEDGEELADKKFSPARLIKVNAAREKLMEQLARKWKIDQD